MSLAACLSHQVCGVAGGWFCTGGSWQKRPLNTSDIANGTAVCPLIGEIGGFL